MLFTLAESWLQLMFAACVFLTLLLLLVLAFHRPREDAGLPDMVATTVAIFWGLFAMLEYGETGSHLWTIVAVTCIVAMCGTGWRFRRLW